MIAAARRRPRTAVRVRLVLAGAALLAIFGVAAVLGRGSVSSPPITEPAPDAATSVAGTPAATPDTVTFADPESGFSIDYPAAWRRLEAADEQVRLLVTDGAATSLLVRDAPLGLEVTPDTLGIARDLTDTLVRADRSVRMLVTPEFVTLDGLPGVRYRYTYSDGRSGGGAHVHYFLFKGSRLLTLVFQVPGVRALERRSGLLDRVAGTFRATD